MAESNEKESWKSTGYKLATVALVICLMYCTYKATPNLIPKDFELFAKEKETASRIKTGVYYLSPNGQIIDTTIEGNKLILEKGEYVTFLWLNKKSKKYFNNRRPEKYMVMNDPPLSSFPVYQTLYHSGRNKRTDVIKLMNPYNDGGAIKVKATIRG